jgi:hypothetical protein
MKSHSNSKSMKVLAIFFFLFLSNLSLVRVYASMLIFLVFLSLVIFR